MEKMDNKVWLFKLLFVRQRRIFDLGHFQRVPLSTIAVFRADSIDRIVGDGFPVPQPTVYGFAENNMENQHFTAGTGNPSPTMALINRLNTTSG